VSDWCSGRTKTIEGSNLVAAAEFLKVRAKWLSDGVGPMRDDVHQANIPNNEVAYLPKKAVDRLTERLLDLFSQLDTPAKKELIGAVEFFVAGRRPHRDGPASEVAGKK
jgi:hypothetical protein